MHDNSYVDDLLVFYRATIGKSGRRWLVSFADCQGCLTEGNSKASALDSAKDALEGWLEAHLQQGNVPPHPRTRSKGELVEVDPRLAAVLQIRWRRAKLQLTQGQVAKRAGVSQQQIAKLEDPDGNPTIATLAKIAEALGQRPEVSFHDAAE